MAISGFIIGIVAILGTGFSFIVSDIGTFNPFGWFNWFNIPVAIFGLILSIAGILQNKQRGFASAGIILCGSSVIIGYLELLAGNKL